MLDSNNFRKGWSGMWFRLARKVDIEQHVQIWALNGCLLWTRLIGVLSGMTTEEQKTAMRLTGMLGFEVFTECSSKEWTGQPIRRKSQSALRYTPL
jgi:steroid 5-alpha reductase family enzyme